MSYEGSPLPQAVREQMEAFFGVDLSTVRVHTSDEPARVGALALTIGEDIHVAPGQFDPFSPQGLEILGHELTHVLQQRDLAAASADAAGTGGVVPVVVDAGLEAEADHLGRLAARWRPGLAPARRHSLARAAGAAPAMAQPFIHMAIGTGDDPGRYGQADYQPPLQFTGYSLPADKGGGVNEEKFVRLTDYADTRAKVVQAMRFLFDVKDLTTKQEEILKRWMRVGGGTVTAELKFFFVFGELAWALAEEEALELETGDDSLAAEKEVARQVLDNREIADLLGSLAARFHLYIKAQVAGSKATAWAGVKDTKPTYYGLHDDATYAALVESLAPANQTATVDWLIARLHDAKDLVQRKLQIIESTSPPFVVKLDDSRVVTTDHARMRYNLGTVDEADGWVRWMREQKRAVWAGPSYTMRSMWRCARLIGGTDRELMAMGYAMYAFWCLLYPHRVTPIHRFHETFAAAHEFGLPYLPVRSVTANYRETWPVRARL